MSPVTSLSTRARSVLRPNVILSRRYLNIENGQAVQYGERLFAINAVAPGFFISTQNRAVLVKPDGSYSDRAGNGRPNEGVVLDDEDAQGTGQRHHAGAQVRPDADVQYLLRIGDTALILAQRISEWTGHAPVLEEDIALANMALDLIGQCRAVLTRAGEIEGAGHDEDQLAFLRDERDFLNVVLAELPNVVGPVVRGAGFKGGQKEVEVFMGLERESAIRMDKLQVICPSCNEPARLGSHRTEDGNVRFCRKCKANLGK